VGLFVDIPKPKCWPPPKDAEGVQKLMAYGFQRDPIGDKIHTIFACLFMFCLPIDTVPSAAASAILIGYAVLRLPTTWRTITPALNSKIFMFLIAWTGWSVVTILWSSDRLVGLDHAKALRMVLLPVVLWPVMRHWSYLLIAFLAGVLLQNMLQLSELIAPMFGIENWLSSLDIRYLRGLEKHSGKLAMFMGFASLSWLGIIFSGKKHRIKAILFFALATLGMFVTASMAVTVGYVLSVSLLGIYVIVQKKISIKQIFLAVVVMLVVTTSTWFAARDTISLKVDRAIQGVQEYYHGNIQSNNSTIMRLHWMSETLSKSFDEPAVAHGVFGHGLGSVASIDFSEDAPKFKKTTEHIHNSYVQILYEEGVVGLLLFLLIFCSLALKAKQIGVNRGGTIYPICLALTLFWATATFFENSQSSGRPLAMLILLCTFVMYFNKTRAQEKSQ
jgi:hypothetical protein